jgi:hypothetical protein
MNNDESTPIQVNLDDYEPIQQLVIKMMINTGIQEEEDRVIGVLTNLWQSYSEAGDVKAMFIIEEIQEGLGYA